MIGLQVRTESKTIESQPASTQAEEGWLLAAAVAAALVEYRQQVQRQNGSTRAETGGQWRTLARWQQLAGA
jgi:hypothetical protein